MQQITPDLWISDVSTVRRHATDGPEFDEIVTLGIDPRKPVPNASTTGDEFIFPDGEHDYTDFKIAADYVISQLEQNNTILVHCQAGISRSGGVCTVALAETENIRLSKALATVKKARQVVNPAPEIRESMIKYTGSSLSVSRDRLHPNQERLNVDREDS